VSELSLKKLTILLLSFEEKRLKEQAANIMMTNEEMSSPTAEVVG